MKTLLACAALALAPVAADLTAPADATASTRDWVSNVIGWRTVNVAAPQRIPFTARGETKADAEHAAMRKCKASHDIKPGSCGPGACYKS